jgi:hypothetical protein
LLCTDNNLPENTAGWATAIPGNPTSPHQLIQTGRINDRRLRLTCAASPGAFDTVQVKELPSSVDHFADGLP